MPEYTHSDPFAKIITGAAAHAITLADAIIPTAVGTGDEITSSAIPFTKTINYTLTPAREPKPHGAVGSLAAPLPRLALTKPRTPQPKIKYKNTPRPQARGKK